VVWVSETWDIHTSGVSTVEAIYTLFFQLIFRLMWRDRHTAFVLLKMKSNIENFLSFQVPDLLAINSSYYVKENCSGTCDSLHEAERERILSTSNEDEFSTKCYSLWEKVFGNTWSRHICGDWVRECFASRSSLGKRSHSIFGLCIMIALLRILVIFWEQIQRSGLLATHDSCVCNFCRNYEWMAHRMWTGMVYILEIAGDVLQ